MRVTTSSVGQGGSQQTHACEPEEDRRDRELEERLDELLDGLLDGIDELLLSEDGARLSDGLADDGEEDEDGDEDSELGEPLEDSDEPELLSELSLDTLLGCCDDSLLGDELSEEGELLRRDDGLSLLEDSEDGLLLGELGKLLGDDSLLGDEDSELEEGEELLPLLDDGELEELPQHLLQARL